MARTTPKTSSNEDTRVIEVHTSAGKQRLYLPATARITVGPVITGTGKFGTQTNERTGLCLRVYSGSSKDNQLCMIPNVSYFRDLSIKAEVEVKSAKGERSWSSDSDGNASLNEKIEVKRSFRDA